MRYLPCSAPMVRGAAAAKLVLGADAIETFNYFCADQWDEAGADYSTLQELSHLEHLRGLPKYYTLPTAPARWSQYFFEYPEPLPASVEPQCQHAFRIPMCAEPRSVKHLTLQVVVENQQDLPEVGVNLNGSWPNFRRRRTKRLLCPVGSYTEHDPAYCALEFNLDPSLIREGWNLLVVANGARTDGSLAAQKAQALRIASIELYVH